MDLRSEDDVLTGNLTTSESINSILKRTIWLDLETTRAGRIRHVGAILSDEVFEKAHNAGSKEVLKQLDEIASKADFVLGHNLLGHDFPILRAASPWLQILKKPVIDTLYLSPLAFPQNPYHRLVKNYKLVRSSINSPVEDARLAASVFSDQFESFAQMAAEKKQMIDFYRFCFQDSIFNTFSGAGISSVFSMMTPPILKTQEDALSCFLDLTEGLVCTGAAEVIIPELLARKETRAAAAYCLAWLQVAGGNSVLPPWVRHRFPEIPKIIKALREDPCGRPNCGYCADNHDPDQHLEKFFGYRSFRKKPMTEKGESLQKAIVSSCLGDKPVMGILPTGGGKSLCYQLPALVRYSRRGTLTVVISPLQALMKDQVDNLVKKTGTLFADAVSGLQTLPERGEVFERIRLGDTAILYISPEQLRSIGVRNVLRQREVGCWVFDEAHCLSKWGHDFRPDYLYAARFIREFAKEQNQEVPPVACFTATAKKDVIEEITNHFREELSHDLLLYQGGVERENLSFQVIPVSAAEKFQRTQVIIESQLQKEREAPGVIVYAATRKSTEEIAEFLRHQGILAEAFHAGLEAGRKREIIADFVSGQIPVICATNAFGMGIDKENIRLVLHFEMPGSLENYIQEAGRAGRDLKPARCVLLYDPHDAGRQFHMGALSEVKRQEIARLLRALRRKKPNQQGEIVVTSDELLRDEDMADLRRSVTQVRDTKVRASIAWLERAGFLQRNQNLTEVFQGKPLVKSLEEARKVIDCLNLSPHTQNMWLRILHQLMNAADKQGCSADFLAEALFPERQTLQEMEKATGLTAAQIVITALHDLADAGLIDQGVTLSASFRPKGKNNSTRILEAACDLEDSLVKILQEEDPDAENGNWVLLNIRRLNQMLKNEGYGTTPDVLRQLIKGISYDGKGFAASQGSFEIGYIDRNRYQMRLQRSWGSVRRTIFLRQNVARVILKTLIDMAKKQVAEKGSELSGELEMSFTSDELSTAIKSDIALRSEVKKVLPAIDRGLMFLHEQKAITLQGGLAVLRQAMSIRLSPNAKGRYYNKGDYKPLAVHYREKRLQVHVMMRYAELALEKIAKSLGLVFDYFALGRTKFVNKYFADEKELIEKATTAESYRQIVEKLRNPVQIAAVGKPVEDNMLILAGPGSGKTTVIVHRCAYLLEVERVPARQILVLCFNHSSAIMLRKRLIKLVGKPAAGVTVATYHGAAMRLAGISIRDMAGSHKEGDIDFDSIIRGAVSLLKGKKEITGIEPDEMRDRLLGGYTHILVDEYQDIDEVQYDFVSAVAGRSLVEEDGRLTILAVGDDDQNIYTFRGANVRFIRRFQEDYSTHIVYLVENYRSSRHIISASNSLIRNNQDRMKGTHPICINRDREKNLPGGKWNKLDPVSQGRVQIVTVKDWPQQAVHIIREIERLKAIDPSVKNDDFAVLARTKAPLNAARLVLEDADYPLKMTIDKGLPLHRVREINVALEWLKLNEKQNLHASDLHNRLRQIRGDKGVNIWWQLIDSFLQGYLEETSDSILPVSWAIDRFYEFLVEQRREKMMGQGIFLSTVHSAKGMEFPHVFVLDGDWQREMGKMQREEERRVMYVAMTRAEQTLHLFKIPGRENPFLKEIRGDFVIPLTDRLGEDRCDRRQCQYEMLGLNEIYLDYAGSYSDGHSIHRYLDAIESGHRVAFCHTNGKIDILDGGGRCLARLSKEGADKWLGRLDQVSELRVVAMIQRNQDDPDMGFHKRIKASRWELPVLEAVLSYPQ